MEILFYETFVTQTPISKPVSSAADCTLLHRIALALLAIAAIVVIAAVVALLVWVVPLATSGVTAEDAIPKVEPSWVTLYDEEGNAHLVNAR